MLVFSKSKIIIRYLVFTFGIFAPCTYAINLTSFEKAVLGDQTKLSMAYEVHFKQGDEALTYRLLAPFRDYIVDTNHEQQHFILLLDQAAKAAVLRYGLTVKPAESYKAQRQIKLGEIVNGLRQQSAVSSALSSALSTSPPTANASSTITPYIIPASSGAVLTELSCFETVEETYEVAQSLVDTFPSLASLIDIGDSWEKTQGMGGYDLLVLKITNSEYSGDKPKLFIHSAMHAREWATAPLTLSFAKKLLNNYQSDPDIRWIVDYHEVHILFHMNPDGRKIAEQRVLKRKNTNTDHCISATENKWEFGVDLNRNFSFMWAKSEDVYDYGTEYRTSNDECNETFRGLPPVLQSASEPETQAVENYIRSLFIDGRGPNDLDPAPLTTQGMHIDVHAHGRQVLYPYSHTDTLGPNETQLATLARKLAFFNKYNPQPTGDLYLLDGNSESVSYGELGIPQVTFEIGTSFFYNTCDSYVDTVEPDNLDALLYAAKIVGAPYQIPYGPDILNIQSFGDASGRVEVNEIVDLAVEASDKRYKTYSKRIETTVVVNGVEQVEVSYVAVNEPFENVFQARYSIDQPPFVAGAVSYNLQAEDNNYDESEETITGTLNPYSLSPGQHTLYYQAQDSNAQWGAVSAQFFKVKDPLKAKFSRYCPANECSFFGDESEHLDGTITDYHWDFGNGVTYDQMNITHIFPDVGSYPVTLSITDSLGHQASLTSMVGIWYFGENPVAEFTVSCTGRTCDFDASASTDPDGQLVEYEWAFPNNEIKNGMTTDFNFLTDGNYEVSLKVTDWSGITNVLKQTVSIQTQSQSSSSSSGGGGGGSISLLALFFMFLAALFKARAYGINSLHNSIKI